MGATARRPSLVKIYIAITSLALKASPNEDRAGHISQLNWPTKEEVWRHAFFCLGHDALCAYTILFCCGSNWSKLNVSISHKRMIQKKKKKRRVCLKT